MRWIPAIIALLFGSTATAAPLVVRTGDHDTFTRVVIQTRGLPTWVASQTGFEVRITSPETFDGFDLRRVYERITRDRLKDVSSQGEDLVLSLACQCVVRKIEGGPNIAVFDIFEVDSDTFTQASSLMGQTPKATSNWEASLQAAEQIIPEDIERRSTEGTLETKETQKTEIPEPRQQGRSETVNLPLLPESPLGAPSTFNLKTAEAIENSAPSTPHRNPMELSVLEDRLARQIGLAATQGLLTPAIEPYVEPIIDNPSAEPPTSHGSQPSLEDLLNNRAASNMTVHNSSLARLADGLVTEDQMQSMSCETDLFSVRNWGNEASFTEQISALRNELYGEFDRINREAQIALARAYLFHSLGAEAANVIRLEAQDSLVDASIIAMAHIIDQTTDVPALRRFAQCDSDIALWAILGNQAGTELGYVNSKAALRALNKLPYELRAVLAPLLSQKLRDRGETDNAALAMRGLSRTPNPETSAERLEKAEISLAKGDDSSAGLGFDSVAEDNAFESPRALIRFIDLKIANNEAITAETAKLAEAYATEHRGTQIAKELQRVHLLALAKSGQFPDVIPELERSDVSLSEKKVLKGQIFDILTEEADDITFLSYALPLTDTETTQIPGRTLLNIAKRSLSLGFFEHADRLVQGLAQDLAPREQTLLRAQIAFEKGLFDLSIQLSSEFSEPDFQLLQADSFFATGRYAEAAEIYDNLEQTKRAEDARWKIELAATDTDLGSQSEADHSSSDEILTEGPISQARVLAENSNELSLELQTMLADPQLSVESQD